MTTTETSTTPVAQTFVDRMVDELNTLEDKLYKLEIFTGTATFNGLEPIEKEMMLKQHTAMLMYKEILEERIKYYVTQGTPV
jgi:hypothetical protein